jgi:hypothetical protein
VEPLVAVVPPVLHEARLQDLEAREMLPQIGRREAVRRPHLKQILIDMSINIC